MTTYASLLEARKQAIVDAAYVFQKQPNAFNESRLFDAVKAARSVSPEVVFKPLFQWGSRLFLPDLESSFALAHVYSRLLQKPAIADDLIRLANDSLLYHRDVLNKTGPCHIAWAFAFAHVLVSEVAP